MGNRNTKSGLRNAIIYLSISADSVALTDDKFWAQVWSEEMSSASEIIKCISTQEIRMLRDGSPRNFATLVYKMVECLTRATGTLCNTHSQQTAVLNATRILIRLIPCAFEDKAWRSFFVDNSLCIPSAGGGTTTTEEPKLIYPEKSEQEKDYQSYLPTGARAASAGLPSVADNEPARADNGANIISNEGSASNSGQRQEEAATEVSDKSLLKSLLLSICDLLFCPEFTVPPHTDNHLPGSIDAPPEDLRSLVTCDYVWEPGVGFELNVNSTTYYDKSRTELLRLLLACLSETLYETPEGSMRRRNHWIETLVSSDNRHALPLFTSLLNTVFIYKPAKMLPFNRLLFDDTAREQLVELAAQILIATLDYQFVDVDDDDQDQDQAAAAAESCDDSGNKSNKMRKARKNLFIEYMTRIHRSEDFIFIIKGFTQLLNTCLDQGYLLLNSSKPIEFEQELLILFWKVCNLNKKFLACLLKTQDILNIVVPILYHLNQNFQDTTKTALIHIGVFNLLILSGERNFGVRLNKPYHANVLLNLPQFTGSHADLMIIVFHKLILYGHNLHQLYDFLTTIVVNISPYLKALSMLASKCLIQMFEIFSSPAVIFTEPNHHQMVIFLLEAFNNLIQYQFDGNANLVYMIISKREAFVNLAKLPTTSSGIQKVLNKLIKRKHKMMMMAAMHQAAADKTSQGEGQSNEKITAAASSSTNGGDGRQKMEEMASPDPNEADSLSRGMRFEATVSCSHRAYPSRHSPQQQLKQEVSLVRTPDIDHVVQSVHPLDADIQGSSVEILFGSDQIAERSTSPPPPPVKYHHMVNGPPPAEAQPGTSAMLATTMTASDGSGGDLLTLEQFLNEDNWSREPKSATDPAVVMDEDQSAVEMPPSTATPSPPLVSSSDAKRADQKWRPTPEWAKQWKQALPLHTVLRMIDVLNPQVELLKQSSSGTSHQQDEIEAIKFLQNGTLVGLLPVPHPIVIRRYHTNKETSLWFRACTWGIIYVRNNIWTDTAIRLIRIV